MRNGGYPFTVEESAELLREILENTSGNELEETQLEAAYDSVVDMYIAAGIVMGHQEGDLIFGWNKEKQELIIANSDERKTND